MHLARPAGATGGGRRAPAHRSLWLRDAIDAEDTALPLAGRARADVAIVGGGYVGLWTALELKRRDPGIDVMLLEADVCGGGASGRNGGQIHSWWDRLRNLIALCGQDEAVRLARASQDALDELERFAADADDDIELRRDGWLWTATTPAQLEAWHDTVALAERHGAGAYRVLDARELRARTASDVHLAGVVEDAGGTVHPGRLVRALRRRAIAAGVGVHELSPVHSIDEGHGGRVTVATTDGRVEADRVVLATGAWAAALPEFRRRLYVVGSDVVATERVPERLDALGWTRGPAICDSQARVLYYRRTGDGRVVFGRGGGAIALAGRIDPRFDSSPRFAADAEAAFRRVYPALCDVPVEHAWSGPVDRTLSALPVFGALEACSAVVYGVGWSGSGVAQSIVGSRILASLALGADDEWSRAGLVEQRPLRLPPDPVRFVGAHVVRAAVRRQARAEEEGEVAGAVTRRVAALVPKLKTEDIT